MEDTVVMNPNGQLPAYEWAFGDVNIGNMQSTVSVKKELPQEETYHRNLAKMQPRQMRGHLRRKTRKRTDNLLHDAWVSVLCTIFESSSEANPGRGKLAPFLR